MKINRELMDECILKLMGEWPEVKWWEWYEEQRKCPAHTDPKTIKTKSLQHSKGRSLRLVLTSECRRSDVTVAPLPYSAGVNNPSTLYQSPFITFFKGSVHLHCTWLLFSFWHSKFYLISLYLNKLNLLRQWLRIPVMPHPWSAWIEHPGK